MRSEWFFRMLLLVQVTALVAVCAAPPKREVLRLETTNRGCLDEPAPQSEPIELAGPDEGCPDQFTFCASDDAAKKIERFISRSKRWMKQAELSCRNEGDDDATDSN
jgi:hypothetical protein